MRTRNLTLTAALTIAVVIFANAQQQGPTGHTGKKAPAAKPAPTPPSKAAPNKHTEPAPAPAVMPNKGLPGNPVPLPNTANTNDRGGHGSTPAPVGRPFQPPTNVTTTPRTGGGNVHSDPQGRTWETDHRGQLTHYSAPGREARFGDNGRVTQARVTRSDGSMIRIDHPVHGQPRTEIVRAGGGRVVAYGPGRGFSEQPLARPGYVGRTYVFGGQSTVVVYRSFNYGGVRYYNYVPPAYYAPRFYMWAYSPWGMPMAYSWGWGMNTPWLGFYSGYFAPSPVYASPAMAITDQVMAQNLQAAYDTQTPPNSYGQPPSGPYNTADTPVTPEVKTMVSNEVASQIQTQQAIAQGAPAPQDVPIYMDPNHRTFIVGSNSEMTSPDGACTVTPGDILFRSDAAAPQGFVNMTVMTAKAGDCRTGITAQLDTTILQEWYNQFQQQVGSGLATMAGASGLPGQPAPGTRQSPDGTFTPDPAAANAVQGAAQDGVRTEADMAQSSAPQKP